MKKFIIISSLCLGALFTCKTDKIQTLSSAEQQKLDKEIQIIDSLTIEMEIARKAIEESALEVEALLSDL